MWSGMSSMASHRKASRTTCTFDIRAKARYDWAMDSSRATARRINSPVSFPASLAPTPSSSNNRVLLRSSARRDVLCWQRGETVASPAELMHFNGVDAPAIEARAKALLGLQQKPEAV